MNSSDSSVCESEDNLTSDEFQRLLCGICSSIMIFPVTLPCGHHLCLDCFKKNKELVNLLCPFCRLRISCWARSVKNKDKDLIDWQKWDLIQTKFPDLVRIRTSDNDWSELFDEQINYQIPVNRVISPEGEIKREYEEFCQKENERLLAEEMASQQLIQQILNEEKQIQEQNRQNLMEKTKNDEQIARCLAPIDIKHEKTLRNRTYFSD